MSTLAELEAYLSIEHHPDAWSDGDYQHATLLSDTLDDMEWEALRQIWQQRPTRWQAQLADALGSSSNSGRSLALVQEMLRAEDEDVLQSVVDTLECRDDVYVPDDLARARLHELRARFSGTHLASQIQVLLARGNDPRHRPG